MDQGAAFLGGAGNDTFNGNLSTTPADNTVSALDVISGGGGTNTMNITDLTGAQILPASFAATNIQVLNLQSVGDVGVIDSPFDTTGNFTGLTQLNVTQSFGDDFVTVGDGTAVSVTDAFAGGAVTVIATDSAVTVSAKGAVTVDGGSTQTVTAAGAVTLGATTGATGGR